MKYKEDLTQEQRIFNLLRERGPKGVYVYELQAPRPNGLGIAQYNARIWGLRKKGHNIINKEVGHFLLVESVLPTYLKASTGRTEPHVEPVPLNPVASQPWDNLVRVEKNGRVYWEKPEDLEPETMHLLEYK